MAQNRETLETKVTAVGDTVTLKWGQKHPWDAELKARGALLFVEYRSARGTGLDCGASAQSAARGARTAACQGIPATVDADDRTATFKLPETLTAVPMGPVCLHMRMADQRPLPIRRAGKDNANTSRFQFAEWSQRVTVTAQRTTVEVERADAQAAVAQQARGIEEQLQFNKGKGWTSRPACDALQGGSLRVAQDRPVAPPAEHDEIARTVCLMRLANAKAVLDARASAAVQAGDAKTVAEATLLLALTSGNAQPVPLLNTLLSFVDEPLRQEWLRVRGAQAKQFVDDWTRLESKMSEYQARNPTPHFESFAGILKLQSLTNLAARRLRTALQKGERFDSKDVLGVVGGSIEAYGRCVADGKRQLVLNYEQSKSLQANSDSLQARLTQQARQECRQGIEKLDSMQRRLAELNAEVAAIEQRMSQAQAGPPGRRTYELNETSCTL